MIHVWPATLITLTSPALNLHNGRANKLLACSMLGGAIAVQYYSSSVLFSLIDRPEVVLALLWRGRGKLS